MTTQPEYLITITQRNGNVATLNIFGELEPVEKIRHELHFALWGFLDSIKVEQIERGDFGTIKRRKRIPDPIRKAKAKK